jgi:hypothetical protein
MSSTHIERALAGLELLFNQVSDELLKGEPQALENTSSALRQGSIDFLALVQSLAPEQRKDKIIQTRLRGLAAGMAMQKESLLRRMVLVEMALNAVVPATRRDSYAKAGSPFGSPGRQTGAFKYLVS